MTITDQFDEQPITHERVCNAKENSAEEKKELSVDEFVLAYNQMSERFIEKGVTAHAVDKSTTNLGFDVHATLQATLPDGRAYTVVIERSNAGPETARYELTTAKGATLEYTPLHGNPLFMKLNGVTYDMMGNNANAQRVYDYTIEAHQLIEADVAAKARELFEFAMEKPIYIKEQNLDELL